MRIVDRLAKRPQVPAFVKEHGRAGPVGRPKVAVAVAFT